MATSAIGATSSIGNTASANLSMEDLLRVLLTELTFQDPLKPVENKDFMAQIAQFSSLDATQRLNANIEQMLQLQSINQSVGLLGKTVVANTDAGGITGTVSAMQLVNGAPQLTITTSGGQTFAGITIGQIETIR
jgi:flagellar basal-body rod modification protein FlgD